MRAILTASLFTLTALFTFGCETGDVISMTLEQRESQVIPGLGLGGQVAIQVSDIETSAGLTRSGPSIESLMIVAADEVLARKRDVRIGERLPFVWRQTQYEVRIDGFEEHLIRDDEVDLIVYRK